MAECTFDGFSTGPNGLAANWTGYGTTTGFDVTVEADQLVTKMPAGVSGWSWVYSRQRLDMRGARTTVEVVSVIDQVNGDTYFSIDADSDNWYHFSVQGSSLIMRSHVGGVDQQYRSIAYDAGLLRFWRLEHDVPNSMLLFLTSPDRMNWTRQHATSTPVALDSMLIALGVGAFTGGVAQPTDAVFDNFELCGAH
jgi:hypothetical protein